MNMSVFIAAFDFTWQMPIVMLEFLVFYQSQINMPIQCPINVNENTKNLCHMIAWLVLKYV